MKESILKRYPTVNENDIILRDDGEGVFLDAWNSKEPQPTIEQIYQWVFEDAKESKIKELEAECDASIVAGFDHDINGVSYRFSCSLAAQANFQGTDTLFKDGLISEAEWTAVNNETGAVERVKINQSIFNELKLQVFIHINSNISKLRNDLQPRVIAATSQGVLDVIAW